MMCEERYENDLENYVNEVVLLLGVDIDVFIFLYFGFQGIKVKYFYVLKYIVK